MLIRGLSACGSSKTNEMPGASYPLQALSRGYESPSNVLPREDRRKVSIAAQNTQNHNTFTFNPVEDDVFADRETSQARTQVFITGAPNERTIAQQKEAVGDGINQTIGDTDAATL